MISKKSDDRKLESFIQELKSLVIGEVHADEIHKRIYSVDASIFEIKPICIAIPKNKQDLINILIIAKKYAVDVIARGAATGITGGCLGKALIIDLSKYFTNILKINIEKEYVIVEPGVVQDRLNEALLPFGYRLGPDTSTGNRATIGGMMANNSAGAKSLYYGKMSDHVLEVELALATSELIKFQALNQLELKSKMTIDGIEGSIYKEINRILVHYKEDIEKHFPKIPRRVSGYNLDLLQDDKTFNMCKLITGSEGTLGIATEIKLRISKRPAILGICLIHFHDMIEGMQAIPHLLKFDPLALEMIDDIILNTGLQTPTLRGKLDFLQGSPKMIFVCEFQGATVAQVDAKLQEFQQDLAKNNIGYAHVSLTEKNDMDAVWNIRKSGLGLLLSKKSYSRAIAFIEDLSIPPDKLYSFMKKFQAYMDTIGKNAGIYGHVGSGCMHIRPYMDLRFNEELKSMEKIMLDVADLILEEGGALSGEHGDGLIRTWLTEKMFGKSLYTAFCEVKSAFDPENRMNPGKIVNGQSLLENLRLDPKTPFAKIDTFLNFSKEGGFNLAVDLCNGNGMCRKKEGVMCPSFQASEDEYDTTRARAQTLRDIVNGHVPKTDLISCQVHDVLDLCLECKGCKTECPSHIDMAKIKAEVLFQRQEEHGYLFRNYLFGYIGFINSLTMPFAKIFNSISDSSIFKQLLAMVGITKKRNLPKLADKSFSSWFKNYTQNVQETSEKKQVVLFNDTFNEFNEPFIGISAVKVLNFLGFHVVVPPWSCCGRPMISKGLLRQAKEKALNLQKILLPYANANIPIIGLEPSCILTIKDDFEGLMGNDANEIIKASITFDEFIYQHLQKEEDKNLKQMKQTIWVHGHCHQKSLVGMKPTLEILKMVGADIREIDSGCCGMAGSFGYEKEHYDFSMKIGNLKLFPAILQTKNEDYILANGISCRSQILHGTKIRAKHLAEILRENFQLPLS
jgi:FAD/FMN-containing dehydrogenase/Fe-S oxidoreductase